MTEQLMINGERVNASDGGTFEVFDPSTGELLATVAKATKADVSNAVAARTTRWNRRRGAAWRRPSAGAS